LHINKKQGKLWHLSAKKEAYAYPAQRIYHNPVELCSLVFQANLETCQILLIGAILTPGQRTVAAILRIMGLMPKSTFRTIIGS
jgi:hypothetical protein